MQIWGFSWFECQTWEWHLPKHSLLKIHRLNLRVNQNLAKQLSLSTLLVHPHLDSAAGGQFAQLLRCFFAEMSKSNWNLEIWVRCVKICCNWPRANLLAFAAQWTWINDMKWIDPEMIWNEQKWHKMTWTDMNWYEMNWNDMKWIEMIWYEMNRNDLKWHELTWNELKFYDLTWNGMKWYETIWNDMKWMQTQKPFQSFL